MTWPKITIVTPTFNRTEFLEETILSVLNQNYPNLEYIIMDGGSTNPELISLIRKYEHRLAWWSSERDRGHAEAICRGFARSDGEIMNYLCSDDTFLPGCFHAVAEAFVEHPDADIVYGHYNNTDIHSKTIWNGRVVKHHRLNALAASGLHQASVFWRRSLYDAAGGQIGGKDMEYAVHSPDVDLFMRFAKLSPKWHRLDRLLSTFRRHAEQTSTREKRLCDEHNSLAMRQHFPFWAARPVLYAGLCVVLRARRWLLLVAQGQTRYIYYKLRGIVVEQ